MQECPEGYCARCGDFVGWEGTMGGLCRACYMKSGFYVRQNMSGYCKIRNADMYERCACCGRLVAREEVEKFGDGLCDDCYWGR